MKKILILTNYFTPCTLTPSQRISYWAEHFHKLGFYPTIVTREWTPDIKSHFDTKLPLGDRVRHEKYENFEIYYLPFRPGILDRAYLKWGETALRPLFLLVKLLDVLLVNFTLKFTSFANFYTFLYDLLGKEKFDRLIISGEPFYLFKIGIKIYDKFGLKWIADYRDDWTTNELQRQKVGGFFRNMIFKLESFYEKAWVGSAESIVSVSQPYTERISQFVERPGITIENGFEEAILDFPNQPLKEDFTVVYSGTLYPSQDIEVILKTLELAIKKGSPFRLIFLGAGFDIKEKHRILDKVKPEIKNHVEVTERLPRDKALKVIKSCHVVLGIAYGSLKGIPSSKLYEYIGLRKPVLLCPGDKDIMEEILQEVGLGFFAYDEQSCLKELEKIKQIYEKNGIEELENLSSKKAMKYSRFVQMSKIDQLLSKDQKVIR